MSVSIYSQSKTKTSKMNHSLFLTLKKDDETHELVIDTSETFDDGLVKSELIDDEPTVKRIKFDQIWARSPFWTKQPSDTTEK